jgi:hypothetical protein
MRSMRVAMVAHAAVYSMLVSMLVACSSNGTVVSVNVLSSNDTQYNSVTLNGSKGGLVDPGIPDSILHPTSATASSDLRKAAKVRITITQGASVVTRDVVPATATFQAPVLDAAGMPVLDAMGKATQADHKAIAQFYTRFTLTGAWKDGPATVTADALDATGTPFFSAAKPPVISIKENEAVAAFVDLVIPSPPAPDVDGGVDGTADSPDAGGLGGSTGAGGIGVSTGAGGIGGSTGAGGVGAVGGSTGAGGRGGAAGGRGGAAGGRGGGAGSGA